jgi:hypothetical protein
VGGVLFAATRVGPFPITPGKLRWCVDASSDIAPERSSSSDTDAPRQTHNDPSLGTWEVCSETVPPVHLMQRPLLQ